MKKFFIITKIAVITIKTFIEYQILHRNNKDEI